MDVDGKHFRTIWVKDKKTIQIIDQRMLPHQFVIEDLKTVDDVANAIRDMHVRGAGLIGATAAYGMYLSSIDAPSEGFGGHLASAADKLTSTRPTAVNLAWAVKRQLERVAGLSDVEDVRGALLDEANSIADEDADCCKRIGLHGLEIIKRLSEEKNGETLNILTHCNAGWLAFVDWGSATAPIYAASEAGLDVHVWVDETRPRNQGARLTAWELGQQGIKHTVIADNVGGHLMQHGMVDMVIVGSDRTTYTGDVANKVGTYLKALAAKDNGVPFYVALPSSTFDWEISDGVADIPIEQRGGEEVRYIQGLCDNEIKKVLLTPLDSPAANYAFDVTPSRLITGLITERGICEPNEASIRRMYPEKPVKT